MNRFIIASAIFALSSASALAQAAPPASRTATPPRAAATTPAPATPTAATPRTAPRAAPGAATSIGGGFGGAGTAASPEQARQVASAKIKARETSCTGKGPAYKWVPPHVVGDANPKGGYYATNYNGGCKLMSLKEAMSKGLVTFNR